jgi:hypothetical protein
MSDLQRIQSRSSRPTGPSSAENIEKRNTALSRSDAGLDLDGVWEDVYTGEQPERRTSRGSPASPRSMGLFAARRRSGAGAPRMQARELPQASSVVKSAAQRYDDIAFFQLGKALARFDMASLLFEHEDGPGLREILHRYADDRGDGVVAGRRCKDEAKDAVRWRFSRLVAYVRAEGHFRCMEILATTLAPHLRPELGDKAADDMARNTLNLFYMLDAKGPKACMLPSAESRRALHQIWVSIFRNVQQNWDMQNDSRVWDELIVGTIERLYLQGPLDAIHDGLQDILRRIDAYEPPGSSMRHAPRAAGSRSFLQQSAAQFAEPPPEHNAAAMRANMPIREASRVPTPPAGSSGLLSFLWNNLSSPQPSPTPSPSRHLRVHRPIPDRGLAAVGELCNGTWDRPVVSMLQRLAEVTQRPAPSEAVACKQKLRDVLGTIDLKDMVPRKGSSTRPGMDRMLDLGEHLQTIKRHAYDATLFDRTTVAEARGEAHRSLSMAAWGQVRAVRRFGREHFRRQVIAALCGLTEHGQPPAGANAMASRLAAKLEENGQELMCPLWEDRLWAHNGVFDIARDLVAQAQVSRDIATCAATLWAVVDAFLVQTRAGVRSSSGSNQP